VARMGEAREGALAKPSVTLLILYPPNAVVPLNSSHLDVDSVKYEDPSIYQSSN